MSLVALEYDGLRCANMAVCGLSFAEEKKIKP